MKKILVFLGILAGILTAGVSSARLYDYYASQGLSLPPLGDRIDVAESCGISEYAGTAEQNNALEECLRGEITEEPTFGSTLPIAGQTYTLAGSGVTASASSITLTSLTIPQTGYKLQDSDFSDTIYITLEPGNRQRQEIASCTTVVQNANGSATLSGCSRGLVPFTPFTASTTYAFSHGGGTSLIFSDPPQLFNEFTAKANNETITGFWSFPTPISASSSAAATVSYVNGLIAAGVATTSESNFGGTWLASPTDMASSTYNINSPRALYSRYSTSSPYTAGKWIPITESDGKLNQFFIDLTDSYPWTNLHTFGTGFISVASSTFMGRVEFSSTTQIFGIERMTNTVTSTGEAIDGSVTPQAVAMSTTTKNILKADGDNVARVQFYGFIATSSASGSLPPVITEGIVRGFTGLTAGANYYVSDTAGAIATTPGTTVIPVGKALTSSTLMVEKGRKVRSGAITHSSAAAGTQDVITTIGFRPSVLIFGVQMTAIGDSTGACNGTMQYEGTTLRGAFLSNQDGAATALTSQNINTYVKYSTTDFTCAGSGSNRASGALTINSISTDSITTRVVNTTSGGSGGNVAATINYIAIE